MYLPIYLKKNEIAFYQNFLVNSTTPSWAQLESALKEQFNSPGTTRVLRA